MKTRTVQTSVRCNSCRTLFPYVAEQYFKNGMWNESADECPDGYFINGLWICDNCGSCPECGKTLEKEQTKLKSLCDECNIRGY